MTIGAASADSTIHFVEFHGHLKSVQFNNSYFFIFKNLLLIIIISVCLSCHLPKQNDSEVNCGVVVSVYPTATPTPRAYEYVVATGCVSALLIVLLGTMILLIYLLYYQQRKAEEALYRHQPPTRHAPTFAVAAAVPSASFASSSSKSTVMTAAQFGSSYGMSAAQYGASAAQYGGSQSSLSIKVPQIHHSIV